MGWTTKTIFPINVPSLYFWKLLSWTVFSLVSCTWNLICWKCQNMQLVLIYHDFQIYSTPYLPAGKLPQSCQSTVFHSTDPFSVKILPFFCIVRLRKRQKTQIILNFLYVENHVYQRQWVHFFPSRSQSGVQIVRHNPTKNNLQIKPLVGPHGNSL